MQSVLRLQLAAVALVVMAAIAAELSALALSWQPGSPLLWWLNLAVFAPVSALYSQFAAAVPWTLATSLPLLVFLMVVAVLAFAFRIRLVLATLSHMAFAACGLAAFAWLKSGPATRTASLGDMVATFDAGGVLVAFLLAGTLVGCVVTHISYFFEGARRLTR